MKIVLVNFFFLKNNIVNEKHSWKLQYLNKPQIRTAVFKIKHFYTEKWSCYFKKSQFSSPTFFKKLKGGNRDFLLLFYFSIYIFFACASLSIFNFFVANFQKKKSHSCFSPSTSNRYETSQSFGSGHVLTTKLLWSWTAEKIWQYKIYVEILLWLLLKCFLY